MSSQAAELRVPRRATRSASTCSVERGRQGAHPGLPGRGDRAAAAAARARPSPCARSRAASASSASSRCTRPSIDRIEVVRRGKVRRAKLYYLRDLRGKAARIEERRDDATRRAVRELRRAAYGRRGPQYGLGAQWASEAVTTTLHAAVCRGLPPPPAAGAGGTARALRLSAASPGWTRPAAARWPGRWWRRR